MVEPSCDIGETYVEDCYVCCRPIEITVTSKDDVTIEIRTNAIEGNAF